MGAKTYTEITLAAPTNVAATLNAGGSLTAGTTYYYKVLALSCEGWSISFSHCNCESELSAEVSATCDASNKQITISWDAVANADYYVVLRTLTSGNYAYGTAKWISATGYVPHLTGTSFQDTGTRSTGNFRVYIAGLPCIKLDGGSSSDYIDEDWIYTQMTGGTLGSFVTRLQDQSSTYSLCHMFNVGIMLGSNASNPTFFKLNRAKFIIINGRIDSADATYVTFSFGTLTGSLGYGGPSILLLGKTYSSGGVDFPYGGGTIYGTRFCCYIGESGQSDSSATYGGYLPAVRLPYAVPALPVTVRNSVFATGHSSSWGGAIDFINCLANTNMYLQFLGSPSIFNITGGYISGSYWYSYSVPYVELNDVTMQQAGWELIFHSSAYYHVFFYRNCTFYNSPIKGDGISNPTYLRYYEGYSFDLTVVDNAGAAIEGATVAIEDVNGYNCVWSASGATLGEEISATEVSYISVSGEENLSVNDVIMINLEKMIVTAIDTVNHTITVTRNAFEDVWQPGNRTHSYLASEAVHTPIYKRTATVSTDSNGQISTQRFIIAAHYDYNAGGATGYKYTKTTHNPYKITISKSGYETLILDNITFSEKAKWRVELQKSIKMDLDGNLLFSANADNLLLPL